MFLRGTYGPLLIFCPTLSGSLSSFFSRPTERVYNVEVDMPMKWLTTSRRLDTSWLDNAVCTVSKRLEL